MAYTIELSAQAYTDIDEIVGHIQRDSPTNATRWRKRLFEKIETFRLFPHGCAIAPEDDFCSVEVRQTMLGKYRVLFTVIEGRSLVYVLSIRHASRRLMPGNQLSESARDVSELDQSDEETEK